MVWIDSAKSPCPECQWLAPSFHPPLARRVASGFPAFHGILERISITVVADRESRNEGWHAIMGRHSNRLPESGNRLRINADYFMQIYSKKPVSPRMPHSSSRTRRDFLFEQGYLVVLDPAEVGHHRLLGLAIDPVTPHERGVGSTSPSFPRLSWTLMNM